MERTDFPLVREFSALAPYQEAYTLVYTLEPEEQGCWLNVERVGAADRVTGQARTWVPAMEKDCRKLLCYLYENAVQPELWQDTIACWYPQAVRADIRQEGGALSEPR